MKFKDWFSFKGIRAEMKHVTWLTKKQLVTNSATVIAFCLVLGIFFFVSDLLVAFIMRMLGLS